MSLLGFNGRIEYSIIAGDENIDFGINENGTVYTKRMLDRETTGSYNLIVSACDMAREPEKKFSSTVQVKSFHSGSHGWSNLTAHIISNRLQCS